MIAGLRIVNGIAANPRREPLPAAIRADEATAQGFHILAGPYREDEHWMLLNVVDDLRSARRDFALVRTGFSASVEVWIRGHHSVLHAE